MITVPEGVNVEVQGTEVKVRGPKGELGITFAPTARITMDGREIKVEDGNYAYVNTVASLIRNMITGVTKGFEKKLKVVYAHFPISVEVKGKEIIIKNFQGEKQPRKTKIAGPTKVEVKGQAITVSGPDKEAVGQTAANLRTATKIRKKDPRIFQDGIYVVEEG